VLRFVFIGVGSGDGESNFFMLKSCGKTVSDAVFRAKRRLAKGYREQCTTNGNGFQQPQPAVFQCYMYYTILYIQNLKIKTYLCISICKNKNY
jgi:hypothetical protein